MSNEENNTTIDRIVGLEVEYRQHEDDNILEYENEYYSRMKEINRLLLPMHKGDTLSTLKTIKNLLVGIDSKLGNPLGTFNWATSYGHAFNGLHLHISHKIDRALLTRNILRVIGKWGITPRVATSWHVRAQPSFRSFKAKGKYTPVHVTPRGTTEIRILDIEYFYNDEILVDIAQAIDYSCHEVRKEVKFGDYKWFNQDCYNEDLGKLLMAMEKNMAPWYTKTGTMSYTNKYTGDQIRFNDNYDRNRSDFDGMTRFKSTLRETEYSRMQLTKTKVKDIFDIEAPDITKDFIQFRLDNKNLLKLKYDMSNKCVKGKLIHVPFCMAQGIRVKAATKLYANIPNDAFIYLGRSFSGLLDISNSEELDKFVEAKLEELFRIREGN